MARSSRIDWRVGALAGAIALGLASCAEFNTVVDVVFPSTVPGLPAEQGWESLPLRRWLTESGIEPIAISACFQCRSPAVAGLFEARGPDVAAARRAVGDPRALAASLTGGPSRSGRGRRPARARADAAQVQEGGVPGMIIRLSRGRRQAAGYVASVDRAEATRILVIVASSEEQARSLARGIVPRM